MRYADFGRDGLGPFRQTRLLFCETNVGFGCTFVSSNAIVSDGCIIALGAVLDRRKFCSCRIGGVRTEMSGGPSIDRAWHADAMSITTPRSATKTGQKATAPSTHVSTFLLFVVRVDYLSREL